MKFDLLGVPEGPVVSEAAAAAMAAGARRVLGADVGLALTGVAGPTEQDGMPVGTLCVGIDDGDDGAHPHVRLPGQREQMRQMSVITALDFLRRTCSRPNRLRPRLRSSTDRAAGFYPVGWEFESSGGAHAAGQPAASWR